MGGDGLKSKETMIINWDFVKKKTLWNYEELIKKLYQAFSYDFVKQHDNHTIHQ